jgi:uncharacterized membrane protein
MVQLTQRIEHFCLLTCLILSGLGLIAIAFIFPQPDLMENLPPQAKMMLTGGIQYQFIAQIVLASITIGLYAWRTIGFRQLIAVMLPSMILPVVAEMFTIKTGFPFGYFVYPDSNGESFIAIGLGAKVADLVPWTISLWWFFGLLAPYLLARAGLAALHLPNWLSQVGAIGITAMLPTAWDIAFEPAMKISAIRFWDFQQSGSFFGIPAYNFPSFFIVILVVLGIASLLGLKHSQPSSELQPDIPLVMYLSYFSLTIILDISTSMWIPLSIGLGFGLLPAIALWWLAKHPISQTVAIQQAN